MNSGKLTALAPNPPPTAGAITRTRSGGVSSAAATASRKSCGRWVLHHSVTASVSPPAPGAATTADGSIGAADMRWLRTRALTVRSCPVIAAGSAALVNSMARFDPWASITTGASGSSASNGSTTAGSGS